MSHVVAMLSVHTSPLDSPGRTKDAGGMNVYMRELATELGRHHVAVDIFTRWTNEYTPQIVQLAPNVRVIHIEAGPRTAIHKHELFHYLPPFIEQIKLFTQRSSLHYTVLHSHYWLSGVAGIELANCWDIPHVTMFHTQGRLKQLANPDAVEPQQRLEMEQHLLQAADCVIAATADERMQLIRHCGATANRVQVIPCGVDLKLFTQHNRQCARRYLELDQDQPVVLFVGRLDPFKGPDLLLRAAAMMEEDAQLVIVGGKLAGDPELQQLQALASELHLASRVRFLGAQPQQELPMLYSAADVTVVPSYHESFGLVAIESLACGTPVVATRAGGLTTVVRHDETGFLVQRCPGIFAQRIDALVRDSDLQARMRLAARSSVLQFSWRSVAGQVHEVYDELVAEAELAVAQ